MEKGFQDHNCLLYPNRLFHRMETDRLHRPKQQAIHWVRVHRRDIPPQARYGDDRIISVKAL